MTIAQEEIFGPVLSVIKFSDDDDAVRKANDSIYGLASAVWSQDPDRCLDVAKRLRAGTVWINDYHLINCVAPFGGYKQSGVGREEGIEELLSFTREKNIHINLKRRAGTH
jgi:acyl-CoA reductase-like NAD-dependent aldehyde dehydrogenase